MIWKQFTHLGNFPPELKSRFNSFLTTEFDDSLSVEMQLRSVIKWCQGNFKTVDTLIDFINDVSNWLKQFETDFDTKLEDSVITVLSEWQASGHLDVVISEALQWELDDFKATTEQNFISVNQELQETEQELSSELAQTVNKLDIGYVNVLEFGAIGDYLLPDGSVNPNPTDNTQAIQSAFNTSRKVQFPADNFYCSGSVTLPKNPRVKGNDATLFFDGDGFDLGGYGWNIPHIENISFKSTNNNRLGRAIYGSGGDIVFPVFYNILIDGFSVAIHTTTTPKQSNFSWGKIDKIQVQYCDRGIVLDGGWINTILFTSLSITQSSKSAMQILNASQIHSFAIDKGTIDFNCLDSSKSSAIEFIGCQYGEISINNLYIEQNGKSRMATAQEITEFKTLGTKIEGLFYDSMSYLKGDEVYSEDTHFITDYDIGNGSTLLFEDCLSLRCNLTNISMQSNLYGLASLDNDVKLRVDNLSLSNNGNSFPNMRHFFKNLNPTTLVEIYTQGLHTVGGGLFDYGENVVLNGDTLGLHSRNKAKLVNGWTSMFGDMNYYLSDNMVHFQGSVAITSLVLGSTIFTLPRGFRPSTTLMFSVPTDNNINGTIYINPNGEVSYNAGHVAGSQIKWASLTSISFSTK